MVFIPVVGSLRCRTTVHIGLGQLRRIVNEGIRQFGPPSEIAAEFTRA